MKIKLEYIWLDGKPEPNLIKSKTKVWDWSPNDTPEFNSKRKVGQGPCPEELPNWDFEGEDYIDYILKPVRVRVDSERKYSFFVMCEVYNVDGTPHESNLRHLIEEEKDLNDDCWFSFDQEYVFKKNDQFLGDKYQNDYRNYCGVGIKNVIGRDIVEEHLDLCLSSGLEVTGVNSETLKGQWGYQLFGKGGRETSDDLWISRFILLRVCEKYEVEVNFLPYPSMLSDAFSKLHVNFSNSIMREIGGEQIFTTILHHLKYRHDEFIKNYGCDLEKQPLEKFVWGVNGDDISIQIPHSTIKNNWLGYLIDRRPNSNSNPYKITKLLTEVMYELKDTLVISDEI